MSREDILERLDQILDYIDEKDYSMAFDDILQLRDELEGDEDE